MDCLQNWHSIDFLQGDADDDDDGGRRMLRKEKEFLDKQSAIHFR